MGESDFCIDDVSIDTEGLEVGDTTVIEVTITNVGNETSNARIIQGLNHPEGLDYAKIEDVNNVKSGESVTVSSSAEIISTGYREINIMLFNERETHLFDSTGYEYSYQASADDSTKEGFISSLSAVHFIMTGFAAAITIFGFWRRG